MACFLVRPEMKACRWHSIAHLTEKSTACTTEREPNPIGTRQLNRSKAEQSGCIDTGYNCVCIHYLALALAFIANTSHASWCLPGMVPSSQYILEMRSCRLSAVCIVSAARAARKYGLCGYLQAYCSNIQAH